MNDFPDFLKNPLNRIASSSQYTAETEGYVFDGLDGSQAAFWKCHAGTKSGEHMHEFDEYMLVVKGRYTLIIGEKKIPLGSGQEYHIPKSVIHSGECSAGTRTIHVFGGRRAKREGEH